MHVGVIVVTCCGSIGKAKVTEAFIWLMYLKNAGCLALAGVFNL